MTPSSGNTHQRLRQTRGIQRFEFPMHDSADMWYLHQHSDGCGAAGRAAVGYNRCCGLQGYALAVGGA